MLIHPFFGPLARTIALIGMIAAPVAPVYFIPSLLLYGAAGIMALVFIGFWFYWRARHGEAQMRQAERTRRNVLAFVREARALLLQEGGLPERTRLLLKAYVRKGFVTIRRTNKRIQIISLV